MYLFTTGKVQLSCSKQFEEISSSDCKNIRATYFRFPSYQLSDYSATLRITIWIPAMGVVLLTSPSTENIPTEEHSWGKRSLPRARAFSRHLVPRLWCKPPGPICWHWRRSGSAAANFPSSRWNWAGCSLCLGDATRKTPRTRGLGAWSC